MPVKSKKAQKLVSKIAKAANPKATKAAKSAETTKPSSSSKKKVAKNTSVPKGDLTARQKSVLSAYRVGSSLVLTDIADDFEITVPSARLLATTLVKKGKLKVTKEGRPGRGGATIYKRTA